jgi:hypothetical protein
MELIIRLVTTMRETADDNGNYDPTGNGDDTGNHYQRETAD